MTAGTEQEKTRPPRRTLRTDSPVDLFAQHQRLAELVKHRPRGDENGLQFLTRLRGSTTPEEAVTFTAFSALPVPATGTGIWSMRACRVRPRPSCRRHDGAMAHPDPPRSC